MARDLFSVARIANVATFVWGRTFHFMKMLLPMGALIVVAAQWDSSVLPRVDAVPVELATRRQGSAADMNQWEAFNSEGSRGSLLRVVNRRACKSDTTRSEAMSFGPDLQDDHTVKRGKQWTECRVLGSKRRFTIQKNLYL
ncbi:hypothetical protein EDB83DRAFT_827391 [Lactarius deliciosus]|nr:hypothetical protein EDB83DRAFT_827391 [Lactarius deliciosus]